MGINVYQVGVLNTQMFGSGGLQSGSYASEFPLAFDNINASGSRLTKIMGVYASVDNQDIFSGQQADSWGQPTGMNNNNSSATPCRPNGGYFIRGLWFSNTAFAPSPNRNGYVGSFVSGMSLQGGVFASTFDFAHDINAGPAGGSDYEPIYSHGVVNPPTIASIETQWRDGNNQPSDGADLVQNFNSAYTRTAYMPPSTFLLDIDNVGAQTVGAGNVTFHIENRPSLRAAGYSDGNPQIGGAGSNTGSTTIQGIPGPYGSDPQKNSGNPLVNAFEYYQASGTRPLNSRGLSLHLAKVMDNWWSAYGYVYEEDGVTLAPQAHTNAGHPIDLSVNAQQEYLWQRDQAISIASISNSGTVATINLPTNSLNTPTNPVNPFSIGQVVYITGLSTFPNYRMNGQFFTILSSGFGPSSFQVNFTTGAYALTPENPYGYAVSSPDFRVRQAATFNINEEYYGMVMDTKCTIWSNKATMLPLLFFDLASKWTAVHPRIAGVSVVPTYINATQTLAYQIFFLSEDGYLARYDFTQTNGVLELAGSGSFTFASSAPTPAAAGEAYGALRTKTLTAPITATSVTANVLTVTCANNFQAGDVVNITGTAESFLNNQTVTVLSSGLSTSQFEANYTTGNYTNASDTGTATGYQVWALYGTMTPDPRTTQTGLTNNANINLYKYTIGTGAWSSKISSSLTGRHNGRSLSEMIVKRDGRIYILCEDVTTSAGFTVSNSSGNVYSVYWQVMCYDPVTATWNVSKINGGTTPLQYGVQGTVNTSGTSVSWVSGSLFVNGMVGQPIIINGVTYFCSSFSSSTSINLSTSAGTQTGVGYNWTNMGPYGTTTNFTQDFWFYNINAFLHDVAPNSLLVQSNWSAGSLQVLDTTSAPTLTNANITPVAGLATLFSGYGITTSSPYFTYPDTDPVTIIHNSDYSNGNGDRTVFLLNLSYYNIAGAAGSNPAASLFYAPPSFNWASPIALKQMLSNPYSSGGPNNSITAFNDDCWSFQFIGNQAGATFDHVFWFFPTQLRDNYIHFVRGCGGADGVPSSGTSTASTYGKSFGQVIGYLPTYFKWTGSAWLIADDYADAVANPYTVPAYGTGTVNTVSTAVTWVSGNTFFPAMVGNPITINSVVYTVLTYNSTTSITLTTPAPTQGPVPYVGSFSPATPLPYGLQVQWGPTPSATYSQNEFQTYNVAVGNTKYTRKGRFSWAMFAGQTFLNAESRNVSDENAMTINFVDTDVFHVPVFTAPTSATPNTATLTNPALNNASQSAGWNTQVSWPKLDAAHAPFDATPLVMTVETAGFNPATWIIPPAYNPSGNENNGSQNLTPPGVNPWTWTVGANTYVSSESQRSPLTGGSPAFGSQQAWSGNPQSYWVGGAYPCWNMIDLGTGNSQICRSYTWRTPYDGSDGIFNTAALASYQLQASNTGTFTDNGGGAFVIDDRTGSIAPALTSWTKAFAQNCNGPNAGTPYRYYRIYSVTGSGNGPAVGCVRLNSAVMTTSVSFTDFAFLAYGSQDTTPHFNPLLRDWQWARGLKIEVSTTAQPGPYTYTTIMEPNGTIAGGTAALWRSHNGNVFSFPRQVGITSMRITVQHGYNFTNASGNVPATTGFGPFYLLDYGTQTQLNTARLGTNGTQGSPTQVSWDYNSLGVATDVMSISIDGASPNMFQPYSTLQDYAVFGFWDFVGVPAGFYKVHPFYGFLLFPGAGGDAGTGTQSGTSAALQYQWGRRA